MTHSACVVVAAKKERKSKEERQHIPFAKELVFSNHHAPSLQVFTNEIDFFPWRISVFLVHSLSFALLCCHTRRKSVLIDCKSIMRQLLCFLLGRSLATCAHANVAINIRVTVHTTFTGLTDKSGNRNVNPDKYWNCIWHFRADDADSRASNASYTIIWYACR